LVKESEFFRKQETEILIEYVTANDLWVREIKVKNYVSQGAEQKVYHFPCINIEFQKTIKPFFRLKRNQNLIFNAKKSKIIANHDVLCCIKHFCSTS
jgi:hypothetical protein